MTILNKIIYMNYLRVLLLISFLLHFSCNEKKTYLEKAIHSDAVICVLIHSGNSEIILVNYNSHRIIDEVEKNPDVKDAYNYICESIRSNSSIPVSIEFYEDLLSNRIFADSLMDSIHKQKGVNGLLNTYFKKAEWSNNILILRNEEERFVVKGDDPYPAFGNETNTEYMCYLLSKHNIYLKYIFIDEILMMIIDSYSSDINKIKQ